MQLEIVQVLRDPMALFRPKRPEPSYPALPVVRHDQHSNVEGLYLAGDVAGTPLIKLGLNQGHQIVDAIAAELGSASTEEGLYDVVVIGAGCAGFGAMLRARELGLNAVCVESEHFANTIVNMTKGKVLFAEPHDVPLVSSAWLEDGAPKEQLLAQWEEQRKGLDIRLHEKVVDIQRNAGELHVTTVKQTYRARRAILAVGKAGNPRKAGVPGELEHADKVEHFLSDPDHFRDEHILVYGGGDVAMEAALHLCEHNTVTLATIDSELIYPKKRNKDAVLAKVAEGKIDLRMQTWLRGVGPDTVAIEGPDGTETLSNDHVFEMIGAELPLPFFRKVGIRMASDWTAGAWAGLVTCLLLVYGLYAVKSSSPVFPFTLETDPQSLWDVLFNPGGKSATQNAITGALDGLTSTIGLVGHNAWYALLYTVVVAGFGIRAARRWGGQDPHQYYRFASIIFFQVFFFVMIEGFLVNFLGLWGPEYAKNYWRGWGIAQPFPLFYNTFFWWYDDPAIIKWGFIGSGLLLTFVGIPLFVRWQGLRFCTWICGCGGLAETLGDQWRHLSPKGERSRLWEFQAFLILIWAFGSAAAIVLFFDTHGDNAVWESYAWLVDFWLVAVLPVGFYPFFGGKIWCRYWCPLANYMKLLSGWYGTLQITSNDKCISCTQCSTYCQVGVDVMAFAKNQEAFDNTNSSCIHCGICIAVCPMDVLEFDHKK